MAEERGRTAEEDFVDHHTWEQDSGENLIEAFARVVSVIDGGAVLEPEPKTSCGGCTSLACSTHSALSNRLAARRFVLHTSEPLAIGDRIVVGMPARELIKAALLAYAIPVATLLGSGIIAQIISGSDPITFTASLAGLFIGLGFAGRSANYLFPAEKIAPHFLRRAQNTETCPNQSIEELNHARIHHADG